MRFQSTLPREERPLQHQLGLHRRIFQSTLPREERRAKRTCLPKEPSDFNPRSHERSDKSSFCSIGSSAYFNPRSHERSDGYCIFSNRNFSNFNPRSHERSDTFAISTIRLSHISIHAPTRGATQCQNLLQHQR